MKYITIFILLFSLLNNLSLAHIKNGKVRYKIEVKVNHSNGSNSASNSISEDYYNSFKLKDMKFSFISVKKEKGLVDIFAIVSKNKTLVYQSRIITKIGTVGQISSDNEHGSFEISILPELIKE